MGIVDSVLLPVYLTGDAHFCGSIYYLNAGKLSAVSRWGRGGSSLTRGAKLRTVSLHNTRRSAFSVPKELNYGTPFSLGSDENLPTAR